MESLGLKRVHRDVSAVMLARGRSVAAWRELRQAGRSTQHRGRFEPGL